MRVNCRWLVGAFCLILTTAAPAEVVLFQSYPGGRTGVVIGTAHMRLGVIPEMGGRAVELRREPGGSNVLHTAPWFFHLDEGDAWLGGEYGGLNDVPTEGWPGPFWGTDYTWTHTNSPEGTLLKLQAESEAIGIEREMLLPADAAMLIVRVRQRNLAGESRSMQNRIHGEFRVGRQADVQDKLFWKEGGALRTRAFVPGSEHPRFAYDHPSEPWSALVDTVEREALVHRFLHPPGPWRVMYWSGHPTPPPTTAPESRGDTAFYNNDRIGPRILVAPGEAIEAEEAFWLLRGLPSVKGCGERLAVTLEADRAVVGNDDRMVFTVYAASPVALTGVTVNLTVLSPNGKPLMTAAKALPALNPGDAVSAAFPLTPEHPADGMYTARAVFAQAAAPPIEAACLFEVDAARVQDARDRARACRAALERLRAAWQPVEQGDGARLAMLEDRCAALWAALEAGDYDAVEGLDEVFSNTRRNVERHRVPLAGSPRAVSAALSNRLERYREARP